MLPAHAITRYDAEREGRKGHQIGAMMTACMQHVSQTHRLVQDNRWLPSTES